MCLENLESDIKDFTILGGGASGICVGYYAKKNGMRFNIHEATDRIGGNAVTIHFKDFRFDSGAHRWHDKYPEITKELKDMMGEDLKQIHVPSHIFYDEKLIDFPLSPLDLLTKLGPAAFTRAGIEILRGRILNNSSRENFEDFAIDTYGRTLADMFLINYSEKLWGLPCKKLSPAIAGKRLNGLNLKTFIKEAVYGEKAKTQHLDGSFYYPKYGIGDIIDKWAEGCGQENILTRSRITKIFHNHKEIQAIEINGKDKISTEFVVNTLPVNLFLNMLVPSPSEEILEISHTLAYQHLKLVVLFLDRPSITDSATVYFPERDYFFTRLYESRNRSIEMSPREQTSLAVEIPCRHDSEYWNMEDHALIEKTGSKLIDINWIREDEIIDSCVHRMNYAYPVFETGFEGKTETLFNYLSRFRNLVCAGRSGKFEYTHLHDMMKSGKEIIENYGGVAQCE
jgi:protoporphyrinogen oxidase